MPTQTGKNIIVAAKVETDLGVAPSAGDAERIRINPSPGLTLNRERIPPGEIRGDMLTSMMRLGSRAVSGSYVGDLSVGSFDTFLQAVMRGTWVAAVSITEATMTSITTTTSTIVAAGGSWLTQGVRVGDIVTLAGHETAANNGLRLRVTGVTATTITVAGTPLTLNASADTSFTLTVLRKLKNDTPKVRRSFTVEEYNADIDRSERFSGCRFHGMTIRGAPNGMATIDLMVTGLSATTLPDNESPYFTDPSLATSLGLVFTDAVVRFAGADIAIATGFELAVRADAATEPVIGSNSSPDVYDEEIQVSGQLSIIREDLAAVERLGDEAELELSVLLTEPASAPVPCMSLFVPRLKVTGTQAPKGGPRALVETVTFEAGKKEGASGYDDTMLTISTSAT